MKCTKSCLCLLWCGMCLMFAYAQEDTVLGTSHREVLFRRFEELIEEDEANLEVLEELLVEEEENKQISGKINLNDLSAEMAFNVLHLSDYQYYQLLSY